MDDKWFSILIELGILCLFGLGYYLFQKRRIIKADKNEIFADVHEITYELNQFLDKKEEDSFYPELNTFCKELEDSLQKQDIQSISNLLNNVPASLPKHLSEVVSSLKERIKFHSN